MQTTKQFSDDSNSNIITTIKKVISCVDIFFFFNDTATTEIYTLSLHDALPISLPHVLPDARPAGPELPGVVPRAPDERGRPAEGRPDRRGGRLHGHGRQLRPAEAPVPGPGRPPGAGRPREDLGRPLHEGAQPMRRTAAV